MSEQRSHEIDTEKLGSGGHPADVTSESPQVGSTGPPGGDTKKEAIIARRIRAQGLAAGRCTAAIAATIHDECEPIFGTTWIRAYRWALGTALADIVEQVKSLYEYEGRTPPRFSETLLSAYESGHKRPGPEYLHYLCVAYRAEPTDLGYPTRCFCGRSHRAPLEADASARGGGGRGGGAHGAGARCGEARGGRARSDAHGSDAHSSEAHGSADGTGIHGAEAGAEASGEAGGVAPHGILVPDGRSPTRANGTCDQFSHPGEEQEDVLRRTLLQLIGGATVPLDGRFFGAVDGVRRHLDDALLRSGVAATTLDQWEEAAAGYGRQYMTVTPLRLLCDVLLDLGDVRRMCETRQSIEAQERLCRLASQLSTLSGMIMIDIGDHRLARSFFRTARTAADETGDRALRGWVVAREALVPLYYGDAREALRLARISQDLAGRTTCAASALAPMIEARALAKTGPGRPAVAAQAKRAIARAHAVFAQLSGDQTADTTFGYTERQLLFHEGEALAGLGAAEADRLLAHAFDAYPATERLDRSLIRFDRAMFKLVRGEVEEALRIGEETIRELPADNRPEIVLHRARDLAQAAAATSGGNAVVQGFREQLAALPAAVST